MHPRRALQYNVSFTK